MSTAVPILIDEVRDHLNYSITEVFGTMLSLEAKPAAVCNLHASGQPLVAGSVRFDGNVTGVFYIHFTAPFARMLTSRMLGMTEAELDSDEMVNDVVRELSNMIVASVKSRLCDTGASCVLSIPTITLTRYSRIERRDQLDRRLLTFRCGSDQILVEFLMKTDSLDWM